MGKKHDDRGTFYFGRVSASLMRNRNISTTAKAIYAYLAVMCGASDECFPSVDTIVHDLNIGRDTFYCHLKELISAGVVEKKQSVKRNGQFGPVVYRLIREDKPDENYPHTEKSDTGKTESGKTSQPESGFSGLPYTEKPATKEKEYKEIFLEKEMKVVDLFNEICGSSFPKVKKLTDSRKQNLKARFDSGYSLDDFKMLFEEAEESDFLKGKSWADFDWFIACDEHMVKTIEGKYRDGDKKEVAEDGEENDAEGIFYTEK